MSLQRFGSALNNMTNVCHMFVLSSCPREEKRVRGSALFSILEHLYIFLGVCGSGRSGRSGARDAGVR